MKIRTRTPDGDVTVELEGAEHREGRYGLAVTARASDAR